MMDRRTFIKAAATAGALIAAPLGLVRGEEGSGESYEGPLFVTIQARGGWDTTYLCNPKGGEINDKYAASEILTAGGLAYAPVGFNQTFFERYASELLVINGVDMSTKNHETGERYMWTGHLPERGYPSFAALCAAAHGPKEPLSFLSFARVNQPTADLVPCTRIPRLPNNTKDTIGRLQDADTWPSGGERIAFHHVEAQGEIAEVLRARQQSAAMSQTILPRQARAQDALYLTTLNATRLAELDLSDLSGDATLRQADFAAAAFKAGLCVSANLSVRGFDTHDTSGGGRDVRQIAQLKDLLELADRLLIKAEEGGFRDRLTVLISSEFSRGPRYNAARGKDHWPVNSALVIGPGVQGGRVVGETTAELGIVELDPSTLEVSEAPGAQRLRPEHLHRALRVHAGISEQDVTSSFPLKGSGFESLLTG